MQYVTFCNADSNRTIQYAYEHTHMQYVRVYCVHRIDTVAHAAMAHAQSHPAATAVRGAQTDAVKPSADPAPPVQLVT